VYAKLRSSGVEIGQALILIGREFSLKHIKQATLKVYRSLADSYELLLETGSSGRRWEPMAIVARPKEQFESFSPRCSIAAGTCEAQNRHAHPSKTSRGTAAVLEEREVT
jgi:hypothetical protein